MTAENGSQQGRMNEMKIMKKRNFSIEFSRFSFCSFPSLSFKHVYCRLLGEEAELHAGQADHVLLCCMDLRKIFCIFWIIVATMCSPTLVFVHRGDHLQQRYFDHRLCYLWRATGTWRLFGCKVLQRCDPETDILSYARRLGLPLV